MPLTLPTKLGKKHPAILVQAKLIKLEETSSNMTVKAFRDKIETLGAELHKELPKLTAEQFDFILTQTGRRQDHGFHWLTGKEVDISIDRLSKLNVNLDQGQIDAIRARVKARKEEASESPLIKKAAANCVQSKHTKLLDLPKSRFKPVDGKRKLIMTIEVESDAEAIAKLACGKTLIDATQPALPAS